MSRLVRHHARRLQRGVAAVELALLLPVIVALLMVPLLFGRIFWHYTVAQKAAHDAALYLSEVPLTDIRSPDRAGFHYALARDIASAEMSDLKPGSITPTVAFTCAYLSGYTSCDNTQTPKSLKVTVQIDMFDTLFSQSTLAFVGSEGLLLSADVTVPYVAN
jgi:Flp pilus assembly protein TadG